MVGREEKAPYLENKRAIGHTDEIVPVDEELGGLVSRHAGSREAKVLAMIGNPTRARGKRQLWWRRHSRQRPR